jgi:hypothetical protein
LRNKERLASLKHLGKKIIIIIKKIVTFIAGNLLHKPKCENKA